MTGVNPSHYRGPVAITYDWHLFKIAEKKLHESSIVLLSLLLACFSTSESENLLALDDGTRHKGPYPILCLRAALEPEPLRHRLTRAPSPPFLIMKATRD
jgi:hypothetical protein